MLQERNMPAFCADRWLYRVTSEEGYNRDVGSYTTYAIELYETVRVDITHDVSLNEDFVLQLVELINKNQVSPCHFRDIVEDFLA